MTPRLRRGPSYPEGMEQRAPADDTADLVSALEVIEAQPLASRADAYEALHDSLSRRLETVPPASHP